jgi:MFS transporter, DHA1 family, inner membrane transport protein
MQMCIAHIVRLWRSSQQLRSLPMHDNTVGQFPDDPMQRSLIVLAVFAAGLGAAAQFGKISVLFDDLARLYAGHGAVAMGWMVSIVGMVGLIFGTTAGLFVGRLGAGRVLVVALVLAGVVSAVQATMPPYPVMMALRVVEGATHLAIVVVGPVLMAGAATARWQGLVMALWGSFFGLSFAGLALVAPGIVAAYGIPGVFVGHALWMGVCAVALWAVLPADARGVARLPGSILARHVMIYASPRIAAPGMGFFCYTILFVALLTLLPPQVPVSHRALVQTAMPLVSIAVSLTIGVWALRYRSAVHVVQVGFVLALVATVALWATWGQGAAMAGAALALSGAFGLVQGASFATIPALNTSMDDRAMAAGALAQLGNLGTVTGTPLLAWMFTQGQAGAVLVFCLPFCVAGIAIHALQSRRRA